MLVSANCSPLLADVLSSIVRHVGRPNETFTLVDLRQHNAIEHDRSFTRLDYRQGDNYSFQPAMFHAMLADAKGGPITATSLARTRARRDAEGKRVVGAESLSLRLWVTTWSQTCILLQIFGEEISVRDVSMLFEEEKLPEWWMRDPGRPTFLGLLGDVGSVFWKHLFVKVPEETLTDSLKGW